MSNTQLPRGWIEHVDSASGVHVYTNTVTTQQTTAKPPNEYLPDGWTHVYYEEVQRFAYMEIATRKVVASVNEIPGYASHQQSQKAQAEPQPSGLPKGWVERDQNGTKWYRIDSVWSGSDEAGILWAYRGGSSAYSYNQLHCNDSMPRAMENGQCVAVPIITSGRVWVGQGNNIYHQLKVTLSVLADVRYNPFESEAEENEEGNWQRLKDWVNFAYVPVMLRLRDANGNVLYHYENNGVQEGNGWEHTAQNSGWVAGDGTWGCMWLCYYDQEDRKSASGLGGWK